MSSYYLGAFYAVLSAVGFGTVPILAIFAYNNDVNVLSLLFLRFSFASIFLFTYIFSRVKKIELDRRQVLYLFLQGGLLYALFSLFYFSAVRLIPASLAVLIFYTYPIIVALLSFIITGEKITKKIILAMILSFIGLILVLGNSINTVNFTGLLFASGAAICYGIYAVFGKHILKDTPLILTTAFVSLFAACSFLITGVLSSNLTFHFAPGAWIFIGAITLITVMGFLAFFRGIELTTPTIVSILSMIEPLITIVLSILLFDDLLTFVQIMGSCLVLVGSAQVLLKRKVKKKGISEGKKNY